MKWKPTPIEIHQDDPFKFDVLGRRPAIEELTNLLKNLNAPFVLGLDSPWGTGKTTFVRMWMEYLKAQGFGCIYLSAWDSDFAGDPLVALLGELDSFRRKTAPQNTALSRTYTKTKKIAAKLAMRAIPVAAKVATVGALDLDQIMEDAASNLASEGAKDLVDFYCSQKDTIDEFRKLLKEFVDELTTKGTALPLIVFVDEIDRCQPPFAVTLYRANQASIRG